MKDKIELLKNPTSLYRGAPFWSLNGKLDIDKLKHQIDCFKQMGYGGFHMHPRMGLATPYFSFEYNKCIKECVLYAKKIGLKAYLYDEDRWPSGYGGGYVTKNKEYSQRFLVLERKEILDDSEYVNNHLVKGVKLLNTFKIKLDNNKMVSYSTNLNDEGEIFYLYLKLQNNTPQFNNETYVDVLNKEAVECFCDYTYSNYKNLLGDLFGSNTTPSIFTDEPQYKKFTIYNPNTYDLIGIAPFTDDFDNVFVSKYGFSLFDKAPELFFDTNRDYSYVRYVYAIELAKRFTESFTKVLFNKCHEYGIKLTGHMMNEPLLSSQSLYVGECMSHYTCFDIPGLDLLNGKHEYTTIKQVTSVAHQLGISEVMCECYGVSRYAVEFSKYFEEGNWLACLGTTFRVPHLSHYSLKGEAKRDYPPSFMYQTPWYDKIKLIEDHFARINVCLKDTTRVIKIGVIHPIESFFLSHDITLDKNFLDLVEILMYNHFDFDFISESILPDFLNDDLSIGKSNYDCVIVPRLYTLRATTYNYLLKLQESGKKIIFIDEYPVYFDGLKKNIDYSMFNLINNESLISNIDNYRTIRIYENNNLSNNYLYSLNEDSDGKWLFITRPDNRYRYPEITPYKHRLDNNLHTDNNLYACNVTISGKYNVHLINTYNGNIEKVDYYFDGINTIIILNGSCDEAFMLRLDNKKYDVVDKNNEVILNNEVIINDYVHYSIDNPNVLLLDKGSITINNHTYNDYLYPLLLKLREEVGIKELDFPLTTYLRKDTMYYNVPLTFTVNSNIDTLASLVCEMNIESLIVNNKDVEFIKNGYYIDDSFIKYDNINIQKGINTITLNLKIDEYERLESCFLLGDFGVYEDNESFIIDNLQDKVMFSDLVKQGLPFYMGKFTYHIPCDIKTYKCMVELNEFATALSTIKINDIEKDIYIAPYKTSFDNLDNINNIDISVYASSENAMGAIHIKHERKVSDSPNWFSVLDERYTTNYCLDEVGLLTKPTIKIK